MTLSMIAGLTAGTHTVHIKDAQGCTQDSVVNIKEPTPLAIFPPEITPPTCAGLKDGLVSLMAHGGTTPYRYTVDPQGIYRASNIFNNLAVGSYTFHVRDSNGCVFDTVIKLEGNPGMDIESTEVTPPTCAGYSNGAIQLNATGGVPPFTYNSSASGITNSSGAFKTLPGGNLAFSIIDSKGCRKDTTIWMDEPSPINLSTTASTVDCDGLNNDGKVSAIADGGVAPYAYIWNTGQQTPELSGVRSGNYTVMVTDANGCVDSSVAVVDYDCCRPFIPDAFTPNGDGRNDIYRMRWRGNVNKLQFSIYNRFGERVFVSYQAEVGWDGTFHGKLCDVGVYFYTVKFICGKDDDEYVNYKGDVTLIR